LCAPLIGFRNGHLRFGQRQFGFGLSYLAFRLGYLALRLVQSSLKRARVDLKKQLPLLYEGAFVVGLFQKVARHLCLDVGVDESIQGPDPLFIERDVTLVYGGNFHFRGRSRSSMSLIGATSGGERCRDHQTQRDVGIHQLACSACVLSALFGNDTKFVHAMQKRGARQSQPDSGAAPASHHPVHLPQHFQNVTALRVGQRQAAGRFSAPL